jgi:hypothetical protein
MRTNPQTIKLAKIRRYIREAIKWHKVDKGMPEFYTSENYKKSKRVKNPKIGDYPYYVKSDKAIKNIAEKIYNIKELK